MKIPSEMDLVFVDQILIAICIICIFVILMLSIMLCGTYYSTRPAWLKFKNEEDIELRSELSSLDSFCGMDSDGNGRCDHRSCLLRANRVISTVEEEDEELLI